MTARTQRVSRWMIACFLVSGLVALPPVRAQAQAQQPLVKAEELKLKAIEAVRAGKFTAGNDYLNQAATLSHDPVLTKMAAWSSQFDQQWKKFRAQRREEYDKTVKQVHILLDKHKEPYALEKAAFAYLLAEDKDAFRKEPWVVKLLDDGKKMADEYEKNQEWVKSLRIYSQLSQIEPDAPVWKEKLKATTRRIRLLALYTPEELKKIQESDVKEREEVDALLNPTTRPTTKPAADEEAENQYKIDWRDTLRDVRMDMLANAMQYAKVYYYRDVSLSKMLLGGLGSLRILATTPALQHAFPNSDLGDANQRASFLAGLDAFTAKASNAKPEDEADLTQGMLRDLKDLNEKTIRIPEAVLVSEFGEGAFGVLDLFSNIIWPSDWVEFQKQTNGEFSGVGIQIQSDEAGNLKVVSPLEDSPAYHAGIKPDYIITHIDGKSARWITTSQAVKRITGPPGTYVTLTVKNTKGESKDYKLRRETIKIASIKGWMPRQSGGWDFMLDPEQKIGYVRMTNFSKTTGEDLDKALEELNKEGARGVIMDLRSNPGGLLPTAVDVVNEFINKGTIVSHHPDRPDSPNPPTVLKAKERVNVNKLPLIVLVNQYSASASEIVSGALKDYHRALLVGERTFGKGSVQMLFPLGGGQAMLKLTTSHYYLPDGKCIHREENSKEWGVDPDVTVEITPEQMRGYLESRQAADILRDPSDPAAAAPATQPANAKNGEKIKNKDPLASDAQLSAALLLMRLQLAGGDQVWMQANSTR